MIRYAVLQCLDCMFYECGYIYPEDPPSCRECGSVDVAVARCRPHNWERYAKSGSSGKQSSEVKEQVPIKYHRRY